MDKKTLKRVGFAALSGMTDSEVRADSAKAFEIALGAMRGAFKAATRQQEHP